MAVSTPGNGAQDPGETKLMAEINVTPMVDVMLVLLVIFMVTAPLLVAGMPVELPKTTAQPIPQTKKPVVVTLALDRSLSIRDERVDARVAGSPFGGASDLAGGCGCLRPRRQEDRLWGCDGTTKPDRRFGLSADLALGADARRRGR